MKTLSITMTIILMFILSLTAFAANTRIEKFINDLGSNDTNKIKTAQEQLLRLKDEAVPELIKALENENVQIKGYTAITLGMMKAQEGVDGLIKSLNDSSSSVRVSAIWALGEIKNQKAIEPLEKINKNSSNGLEQVTSAISLLHLGQTKRITEIIEFLMDENGYVRRTTANALSDIRGEPRGDYEEVNKILNILSDEKTNEEEREVAEKNLIFKKFKALYPLIEALNDKNEDKRAYGALYLGELKNEVAIIPLGILLTRDTSYNVKFSAISALKKIKDKRALTYLQEALKKEKVKELQKEIEKAIKAIKS